MNYIDEELRKRLERFQQYTLAWGKPGNLDKHRSGLDEVMQFIKSRDVSRDQQIALAARIDESTPNAADEDTRQVRVHVPQRDHLGKSEYDRGWNDCWGAFWSARWKRVGELATIKQEQGGE